MRAVLFYWVIGCVLIGLSVGDYRKRCPHDTPPDLTLTIQMIAAWPALMASTFFVKPPMSLCEVQP